jgi:CRP/FNR family transcriptional regulator
LAVIQLTGADQAGAAARAVDLSVFGKLAPELRGRVLEDHRDVSVDSGYRFRRVSPYCTGVVVAGLLRMFVESPDGRQINFRYAGPGYFIGATTVAGGIQPLVAWGVEAMTAARVLNLNEERLRALALSEVTVAWALIAQMLTYQRDLLHMLAGTAFGSIRQRVAMHLLNLGTTDSAPIAIRKRSVPLLSAQVTQQSLADAVGSTRRSVARALSELRVEGVIETHRTGIVLLNPEQLAVEAYQATGAVASITDARDAPIALAAAT